MSFPQAADRRLVRRLAPALLLLALVLVPSRAIAQEADLEPVPPSIFFTNPDPMTADEVRALVSNSFGDANKARAARAQLVYRYQMWSVQQLTDELTLDSRTESGLWNSLLTVGALRDAWGPARELRPLIGTVNNYMREPEPWRRAFAALALGCFHWPQADMKRPKYVDPLVSDNTGRMTRDLELAVNSLGSAIRDDNFQVRVAALLALAKRGGGAARNAVLNGLASRPKSTVEDELAGLIARAFLRPTDGKPFMAALGGESRTQRAASLALAVAMLSHALAPEDWGSWIRRDDTIGKLRGVSKENNVAHPDAVFARGVYASTQQDMDEWKRIWQIAVDPRGNRDSAVAAAQALLFCDERSWFPVDVLQWAARPKTRLREPVLAGLLLLAAQTGKPEGISAAASWLGNGAKKPKGDADWDIRFHAAVGLLRAFHYGQISEPEDRAAALAALRRGVRQVNEKAAFRVALEKVLDEHETQLLKDDFHRLPEDVLLAVEQSFTCPYALLSRDLIDVCVHRLNKRVIKLFNLNPDPTKDGTPQRFLRAYLDDFPYFSRLEFYERRGARPAPSAPDGIDK